MSNNELRHFKYVDKYKKNGKWIYVYPGENATKNAFGRVRGGTGGSLQAHQRLNREATNQVAKNSPSRNIPGAQTSGGKKMSKEQVEKAKTHATRMKKMAKQYGQSDAASMYKNDPSIKSVDTRAFHEKKLREANRETQYSNKTKAVQTSKKQIRQGIRRAKIKTLKRDAAKAISRAKSWFEDLFD